MRRALAAAWTAVLFASAAASAGEGPVSPGSIRAARDAVLGRPEFRYDVKHGKSFLGDWWDAWTEFIGDMWRRYPGAFVFVFAALGLLLLLLIAHIVWTLRMAGRAEWTDDDPGDVESALRRGDPAPFRRRAIEHAAAGRLDEAVRDLYAALLLALDRRGTVRYAAHKALLDYRIEAMSDAQAAGTLDLFAATYHPGSFGRRPPDRARFDELLGAFDRVAEPPR